MFSPEEIMEISINSGVKKVKKPLLTKVLLGFVGGAMIGLGYMAYLRVIASVAEQLGSLASLIGAAIFPIGLIVILLGGGELITGNMMAVSIAWFDKKVKTSELLKNWLVITLANLVGGFFVAYVFGHLTGLTTSGVYLEELNSIVQTKIDATMLQKFLSGIGCNWFVGLSLWLCYGAKDAAGKILAIWFPVMTFVAIGFQHSVANAFMIPAAIFEGLVTWGDFWANFLPVYAGNILGGAGLVSAIYYFSYHHKH
ncbi:formate/nitrite transporter family protein [Enterococcus timonensis]|uniref:formate/nitrite transporter family protein n=1 Tax=Enterococcus timonensis TaxID=1852364 RepID=UPI0008D93966|nr:formate/nitrite transporter family protein [Enterococcus timonensis]